MATDPWRVLERAGLPLGGRRTDGPTPTPAEMAAAVHLARGEARGRERDALCALVLAWSQAWPTSYAEAFAGDGASLAAWAAEQSGDLNRYLKLRRIALANLAEVL